MKKTIVILFLLFGLSVLYALFFPKTEQASITQVNYDSWAKVLRTYVNDKGLVDYNALKADKAILNEFIQHIQRVDVSKLTPMEQKAFWINAYNAITLDVVTKAYPVTTIRTIDLGLVWEKPRSVAGKALSLGHIEHQILRPLGDPRIHFAINCASIGCPDLSQQPFYPQQLKQHLDIAAKAFINNPAKVRLDREENTLYFSEIFSWFEEDFLLESRSIKEYIVKYIHEDDAAYIKTNQVTMKHIPYDWGLNKQP